MKSKYFVMLLLTCFILSFSVSSYAWGSKKNDKASTQQEATVAEPVAAAAETVAEPVAEAVGVVTETKAVVQEAAPAVDTSPEYQKLLNEADELSAKGKFSQAKGIIQKARKLEPKNSMVMRKLIEADLSGEDATATENSLLEAITSDDFSDLQDWATMRYYEANAGDVNAALEKIKKEAVKKPKNIGLQISVAEGYVRLREWDKVAGVYETLVKQEPGDYILNTRLVDVYLMAGNFDAVIKILEPKNKANPDDIATSDLLGRAYTGAGMANEAIALYKKRLEKEPNSPGLLGTYAAALTQFGMLKEALPVWEKAYAADPLNTYFKQRADEIKTQLGK